MKKLLEFALIIFTALAYGITLPEELGNVKTCHYEVVTYYNDVVEIKILRFHSESLFNEIIEKAVSDMWKEWTDFILENIKSGFRDRTSYTLNFEIYRCDDRIISLSLFESAYTGGVHSMMRMIALNYDREKKKLLNLKDLFEEEADYITQINEKVKKYFKNMPLLNKFVTINENQQFYMMKNGIVIFFQPYEYTPYSYGFPKIFISYEELQGFKKEYTFK